MIVISHLVDKELLYKSYLNDMVSLFFTVNCNIAYPTTSHGIWGFIQHPGEYIPRSKAEWDI